MSACEQCGRAFRQRRRGRPRQFCSSRCRARCCYARRLEPRTARPLGPLPHPEGVVALARAVCERALAARTTDVDPLWTDILRATTMAEAA